MSISANVTPSASASRMALLLVRSPVAKPGSVNARMSLRGRLSRSIALGGDDQRVGRVQATGHPEDDLRDSSAPAAAAPARRPGCCRPHSNPVAAVRDPTARTGTARPRGAGRCRPHGGSSRNSMRRNDVRGRSVVDAVVVERAHPQPLGAQQLEVDVGDRAPLALGEPLGLRRGSTPFSQIIVWPSQARSVVDSPSPAAA